MHVIVGIFRELIEVRRHRVVDPKLHRAPFVALAHSGRIEHHDSEFIFTDQGRNDRMARRQR